MKMNVSVLSGQDHWFEGDISQTLKFIEQMSLSVPSYFDNLKAAVKKGGYVLLAEFSKHGAKKCAGLDVHQYDQEEMQQRLGEEFQLITAEAFEFINPPGDSRPYIYGLFIRR